MEAIFFTPPRAMEDKENDSGCFPLQRAPRKSIEWAAEKEVFTFSPTGPRRPKISKSPKCEPRKSILKPTRPLGPFPLERKRDITPTPEDPLKNSQYLEWPVSTIIDESSSLRELTEAYSILVARIRGSAPNSFFSADNCNTRHPLFKPFVRHQEALADAIVRDLGRVYLDPFDLPSSSPSPLGNGSDSSDPPTPQDSPNPKRGGMTEEQVKYARDLSTVTIANMKFLILALHVPAIYNIFSISQLSSILTAVIAIPLTEKLRSPTARKICGFAISLLQAQRLPECILNKAKDRISFAFKRAMDGELGREGKRGAASEAYKAIHELSQYKPRVFVPSFSIHLPTLFEGLLSRSCILRVSATHALGGFVLGLTDTNFDSKKMLQSISPQVVEFFLSGDSDESAPPEGIRRAIQLALQNNDPQHPALGPFWAISVLSSLVILFGSAMLTDLKLQVSFRALVHLGLKNQNKMVRAATSTIWGPLIWLWREWRGEPGIKTDEDAETDMNDTTEKAKLQFSHLLQQTSHLPVGVSFIGALLGKSSATCHQQDLKKALCEIHRSARIGGEPTQRALDLIDRLINSREDEDYYDKWTENFSGKLLSEYMFSVSPGILSIPLEPEVMEKIVEEAISSQPRSSEIRPLDEEERTLPFVWDMTKAIWISCLEQIQLPEDGTISDVFVDIWTGLIRMGLNQIHKRFDHNRDHVVLYAEKIFAEKCALVLMSIFRNNDMDLRVVSENPEFEDDSIAKSGVHSAANQRLRLSLVRGLWRGMISVLPGRVALAAVKPMLRYLVKHQDELVPDTGVETDDENEALSEWAQLLALVATHGPPRVTETLWNHDWDWNPSTRARAWRAYVRGWSEDTEGSWSEAALILGLPFQNRPWDLSDPDLAAWSGLLSYTIEKAAGDNISATEVLDFVIEQIDRQNITSSSSTVRIADYLVGILEKCIGDMGSLPNEPVDLVHEVLVAAYPPEPSNKVVAIWLLRSIQTTINNCPPELVVGLLEKLNDGLCTWMTDECRTFTAEEYSSEIVPLFQTILVSLQSLPPSTPVLQSLSTMIASTVKTELDLERSEALHSFTDFWTSCCQDLETPKGGWSEGLSQVLEIALFSAAPAISSPDLGYDTDDESIFDLPRTSTPRRRLVNRIPLPPSPSPIRIRPSSLSILDNKLADSRRDLTHNVPELGDIPRIPALFMKSPSTASPRSLGGKGQSRRRLHGRTSSLSGSKIDNENKENNFALSEAGSDDSVIGSKRALLDASSTPVRACKRQRTSSCGSSDSEQEAIDREIIERDLLRFEDVPAMNSNRSPFGQTQTNIEPPSTPTKRNRPNASSGTPKYVISPTKRRRMQGQHIGVPVNNRRCSVVEDDDDLPPSDIESEEEDDDVHRSSSPIGPFTPKTNARQSTVPRTRTASRDPASDDSVFIASSSSSPVRASQRSGRKIRKQKSIPKLVSRAIPPPVLSPIL